MSLAVQAGAFSLPSSISLGYVQIRLHDGSNASEDRARTRNRQDFYQSTASISNVDVSWNRKGGSMTQAWSWVTPCHSAHPLTEMWGRRSSTTARGTISNEAVPVGVEELGGEHTAHATPDYDGAMTTASTFEELDHGGPRYPCVVYKRLAITTPYNVAWEWQKQALASRTAKADDTTEPDVMLLTQHDAVFTLGTGSTLKNLKFSLSDPPFEVIRTERGGEVTYHGPGQIVMYPIINLRRYRKDIHWYLRALEETVIRTVGKLGLVGERVDGLTGVWVEGRKVAAVGVRVKRWITMHGLALNVRPDLGHFRHIVPCGIDDRPVGSLEELCAEDQDTSMDRVGSLLVESFEEVFGVRAEAGHLQQRFEEEAQKQPTIEYIFSTPESRFGQVK